ncbi:hypothetical protein Pmani_017936 [Petrolisthes manimaculis]|uniref:Uncharacterized protein n=1 Tax=Petrolisthes manimaculis TaxID=1843537 RepID=A0AAE1PLZ6_9EUCA|nr:hypothetical protein Pmani_017936 [Petrolisthes manimaculis]
MAEEAVWLSLLLLVCVVAVSVVDSVVVVNFTTFESQLEAAVTNLSFPGITKGGELLLQAPEEEIRRKMQEVLARARRRDNDDKNNGEGFILQRNILGGGVREDENTTEGSQRKGGGVKWRHGLQGGMEDEDATEGMSVVNGSGSRRMKLHRMMRRSSSCPGGVGSYGFNSYNFLTFSLQVFNGVINAINRINNNNNNNNDNSQNNIQVNTDQVSSNSNSANAVLVIIQDGKRKRKKRHHNNINHHTSCRFSNGTNNNNNKATIAITAAALTPILREFADTHARLSDTCRPLHVCRSVRRVSAAVGFHAVIWKSSGVRFSMAKAPCELIFPQCTSFTHLME